MISVHHVVDDVILTALEFGVFLVHAILVLYLVLTVVLYT